MKSIKLRRRKKRKGKGYQHNKVIGFFMFYFTNNFSTMDYLVIGD
jgi:hypothetical protein